MFPVAENMSLRKSKVKYLLLFNITGGGLLIFFNDELTTFRNENYIFTCNVEK